MKSLYLIIFINILFSFSCGPELGFKKRMQKILDEEIINYEIHGVSAAVIIDKEETFIGVSGVSHDTVKIKPDMLFAVGSITKIIVSSLTMKLTELGILNLDDPLTKWLPEYPYINKNIKIHQLLNHTSGIYMFWDNENIWNDLMENRQRTWEPQRVLKYIGEPYFDPGEGWHYSNTNYLLMAMIIEKATGSNLSDQLKKYFWNPFGFKNVYLSQQDSLPGSLAHVYGDNLYYGDKESDVTFMPRNSHESITFGSSGIFTTAEELAKWSHLLFGGEVLKKESLEEMFEFIEFSAISNMEGYGLGVQLYDKSFCYGKNAVGHGGANIGTITYMVYLPDYKSTIVVMINSFPNYGADVITKGLIKAVLMEKNALGLIPYFKIFPTGFLIIFFAVILIAILFFSRKKMKAEIK